VSAAVADSGSSSEREQEHVVCRTADLPPGSHVVVDVGRRQIGVFNVAGRYYALPNLCPHQIGPLCAGRTTGTLAASAATDWQPEWVLDGEVIVCPWHGLEFHVPTGRCLAYAEITLRSYEVRVVDDHVRVVVGRRTTRDPA
jgi:nitrite reductase (NADH) small subunit